MLWEEEEYGESASAAAVEERVWELVKGDFHCLPPALKHEASWAEMYRVAYRLFAAHKAACGAEAPAVVPFGPESWQRVNVSGDFKHCLLSLSRWYDDFVAGPNDSHGELYLRCPRIPFVAASLLAVGGACQQYRR